MGVDLQFYMIKRGLTIEKIIEKNNIQSLDEFLKHASRMGVSVNKHSHALIEMALVERTQPIEIAPEVLIAEANEFTPDVIEDIFRPEGRKKKKNTFTKE